MNNEEAVRQYLDLVARYEADPAYKAHIDRLATHAPPVREQKIQGGIRPGGCWVCAALSGFQRGPAQWLLRRHLRKKW